MPNPMIFALADDNNAQNVRVTVKHPNGSSDVLMLAGAPRQSRPIAAGVVVSTKIEWIGDSEARCSLTVSNAKPSTFNRKGRKDRASHLVTKPFQAK